MGPTAQPRPQFVELDVVEVKSPEEAVMQRRAVRAGPRQPGGNRGMAMAEHPHGGGHTEPFSECREYFRDPLGCGFEAVERRHPEGRGGGH